MNKKKYTLMLIPDGAGNKVFEFRLPGYYLTLLKVFGGLIALIVVLGIYTIVDDIKTNDLYRQTLAKNSRLELTVDTLNEKITKLQVSYDRVTHLAKKLQTMAGIDENMKTLSIGPVSIDDLNYLDKEDIELPRLSSNTVLVDPSESEKKVQASSLNLDEMMKSYENLSIKLDNIHTTLLDQKDKLDHTPSIWPTSGYLSSTFGYRISPFTGKRQMHDGLDISNLRGTPILATANGVVYKVEYQAGFGKTLKIKHGNNVVTVYAHCNEILVSKGHRVKRGDVVALMGNSGRSTGTHVHYEIIKNRVPVNPMRFILDEKTLD